MASVALILAAGAHWEPAALARLERTPGLVVLKRCVDVDDLLAAAAAGQSDVAMLAVDAPGLDATVVARLRHHGVHPVAVVPATGSEAATARAARVGIGRVVADDDLDRLPAVLSSAADPGDPDEPGDLQGAVDPGRPGSATDVPAAGGTRGRVIAVWGPAGAPGRTTVATALAAELARRSADTVLVDADPYGGAVAQTLGVLDEVSGLLGASRLTLTGQLAGRDGLASVLRAVGPHLAVVTGLPRADRWAEVRPGALEELLTAARRVGHVVVDTGFCLEEDPGLDPGGRPGRNHLTLEALDAADDLVVVGAADPVGLTRLARGLAELRERGLGAPVPVPVHVVVNRVRPTLGWRDRDIADVAATVSRVVEPAGLHLLPEDRVAVDRAVASGRSLAEAAPDAPLSRACARLADVFVRAPGARRLSSRTAGTARRR
ncbi:MAG TPA: hypothetical protein VGE38_08785 [Nocardioides sp.]|uniref:AAA family ATPase n=1 Tax=Nocardioides sp. TaxID=35761 RepID=UPI002ED84D0F